jgi:integrase
MLVQEEAYFNFVNSINSDATRKNYEYCMSRFLKNCNLDLESLLKLPQQELSNLIIKYLVSQKISSQYKTVIMATIKHACDMNDVILNWKKIKKFIKSEKTGNEISGKDRGYTHEEIQKILDFSDQRTKTAFLILCSTGVRIGALGSLKIGDLERIDDLYKFTVYSGDKEQYITFCTPECAKEIDAYLDFRKRRGENITQDSYLFVRKFSLKTKVKGKPFKGRALWAILEDCISNSGLREIDHINPFKRKQIPIFHGFRKYYSSQLVEADLKTELRWLLEGHNLKANDPAYVRISEKRLQEEYEKAIDNLTIDPANRLRKKVKILEVEKSRLDQLESSLKQLEDKYHTSMPNVQKV